MLIGARASAQNLLNYVLKKNKLTCHFDDLAHQLAESARWDPHYAWASRSSVLRIALVLLQFKPLILRILASLLLFCGDHNYTLP